MSQSPPPELRRAGYLGPGGTFSEEALLASTTPGAVAPVPLATIYDTVSALAAGSLEWALVPIENSLDGSIRVTLDLLADRAGEVEIVGETALAISHSLIAAEQIDLSAIDTVISHPQVPGQCSRFLRSELARAHPHGAIHGGGGQGRQLGVRRRAATAPGCPRHPAGGGDLRRHRPASGRRGPGRQ